MPKPIRVAVVNDYEIVVRGIASMLESYSDRIDIVELDSGMPVVSDVDIALYDTFGQPQGSQIDMSRIRREGNAAKLVIYSWNVQADLIDNSFTTGAHGYIPKSVSADELVDLLERVHAGEEVRPHPSEDDDGDGQQIAGEVGAWPGSNLGLTPRESEVLALICQGFSNDDICDRTHLSLNTLKGYIRNLYRKIDVKDRANAILWGVDHGFRPDESRIIDP